MIVQILTSDGSDGLLIIPLITGGRKRKMRGRGGRQKRGKKRCNINTHSQECAGFVHLSQPMSKH